MFGSQLVWKRQKLFESYFIEVKKLANCVFVKWLLVLKSLWLNI